MSLNPYFGWELLWRLVECDIRCAADVLVAAVHWMLAKNSFHCVGIGDDKTVREDDIASDVLPCGWNTEEGNYSLRYTYRNDLYILHWVIIDGTTIVFNLLNVTKGIVSNINFEIRNMVNYCSDLPKYKILELMPKIDLVIFRVKKELVEPVACHIQLEMNLSFCDDVNKRKDSDCCTSNSCHELKEKESRCIRKEVVCQKKDVSLQTPDHLCNKEKIIPLRRCSRSIPDNPGTSVSRVSLPFSKMSRKFFPMAMKQLKLTVENDNPPKDFEGN